jgi:crotonobetainyl-CoA:carnitine CoA-transferase CaiB-like acyl-CoA transferase
MERFAGQVPAAPILDVGQALDNPFVADSDRIEAFPLEDGTTMRLLTSPIRASGTQLPESRAPALGEDTDAILAEAGICAVEIGKLRRDGVIR